MNKITAEHLARRACVYIRQSTPDQVKYNLESKRRQYGLADRARALGWVDIDVIDDDLGISGVGTRRPGFERLLRALCDGQVGAVFCIEASRLARNGREWHTLLDFCSVVNALLIDAETIYDPKLTNDRLLLGMKGTISEMEVATFRERAQAALLQKAQRAAGLLLAGSAADPIAHRSWTRRCVRNLLAARAVPCGAQRVEEPDLRRGLHLWA